MSQTPDDKGGVPAKSGEKPPVSEPEKPAPKKATPEKAKPRKAAPKKAASKKAAPKKAIPKKAETTKTASKKTTPRKTTPKKTAAVAAPVATTTKEEEPVTTKKEEPASKTAASADPLPEDSKAATPKADAGKDAKAASKAPAKAAPTVETKQAGSAPKAAPKPKPKRYEPPYRSRNPEPAMQDSGGSGKFWLVVAGALVAVFLILSFANSRSFRIVEEEGQATVVKGYFLPWGFEAFVPIGAEAAFNPIPWLDPPKGAVLRGNLKSVSQTYYQLLYFAAAEVRDDDGLFLDRDMQAAAFESWFKEKFAGTPGALDQMSELRHKVKENARATEAFVEARSAVLEQIDAMLAGLPDRPSADVQADAAKFQAFLEEMRAVEF